MSNTFSAGQVTVGTSAVQAEDIPSGASVVFKAHSNNADSIYVGASDQVTSADGYELTPGEGIDLELVNPASKMWFISDTADQVLCWASVSP